MQRPSLNVKQVLLGSKALSVTKHFGCRGPHALNRSRAASGGARKRSSVPNWRRTCPVHSHELAESVKTYLTRIQPVFVDLPPRLIDAYNQLDG